MLELGSGGGSLAFHLKQQFKLTLTDLSEGMLAQNRVVNPEAEFLAGDMRTLRLNRQFDYVLVHDAVCYMTTLADLRAAIETAAAHCRPGGTVIFLPDYVAEPSSPAPTRVARRRDGRGFRYLEWDGIPIPDTTYVVDYAFCSGRPTATCARHDRHSRVVSARGLARGVRAAGCPRQSDLDALARDVFMATPEGMTMTAFKVRRL